MLWRNSRGRPTGQLRGGAATQIDNVNNILNVTLRPGEVLLTAAHGGPLPGVALPARKDPLPQFKVVASHSEPAYPVLK